MATPTKTSLENITSRCLHFFAIIPIRSSCTMCANYPATEQVGTALKMTERIKNYRYVLTFSTVPGIWSFYVVVWPSTTKK